MKIEKLKIILFQCYYFSHGYYFCWNAFNSVIILIFIVFFFFSYSKDIHYICLCKQIKMEFIYSYIYESDCFIHQTVIKYVQINGIVFSLFFWNEFEKEFISRVSGMLMEKIFWWKYPIYGIITLQY